MPSNRVAKPGITVALFDDHTAMRDALAKTLARDSGIDVVAAGSTAAEAIKYATDLVPDVVLLDLNMPGGGLNAARHLSRHAPATKIIVLTSDDAAHQVDAALMAGASAFLTKGSSSAEIRAAIRSVHKGMSELSPSLSVRLLSSRPVGTPWGMDTGQRPLELLEREEQILLRLSQGLTPQEIGESIGLSTAAVNAFMSNVLIKVHALSWLAGLD